VAIFVIEGNQFYKNVGAYRKIIGYCPQYPNLNALLTLQQNLYFAGKYYGMSDEAINVRLAELHNNLGISEYLQSKPTELSGGWKQRYMIARTLIHTPELVILDEPTVGLDPAIRHQLWYYINHIASSGTTILLTTHYLEEAEQLAHRICMLDHGEIKLISTPEQLKQEFQKERLEDVFLQLINQED
jgi:ABC-2 type transport system ATP-binding protein